jgi:hypothetical protein
MTQRYPLARLGAKDPNLAGTGWHGSMYRSPPHRVELNR